MAVDAFRLVVDYELGPRVGHSVQQKKTPDILVDAGRCAFAPGEERRGWRGGQAPHQNVIDPLRADDPGARTRR
jgi:hypothetical protein